MSRMRHTGYQYSETVAYRLSSLEKSHRAIVRTQTGIIFAIAFLTVVTLCNIAFGQDAVRATLMRPDAAVARALADVAAIAEKDQVAALRQRYVMFNAVNEINEPALGYCVNTVLNFAGETYKPIPVVPGLLYRLDLGIYADGREDRIQLLLDTWDRIQDSQFYLLADERVIKSAPRWLHDGQVFSAVSIRNKIPAAHCNLDGQLDSLCELTASLVPIVSAGQFFHYGLDALYYEFRQFDQHPEHGTPEEAFLRRAGVDLKDFGSRNVDQRAVLVRKPTANWGIVEYMPSPATRLSVGPAIATITRDFFEGSIDANKHALENLSGRKHDGSEAIIFKSDGGLEFALFDADGRFVRDAPPNLATDRTVPEPFLPVLGGAIACIRCHGPDAGFKPAANYVTWLRDIRVGQYRFDVFSEGKGTDQELLRLVSLYSGETVEAFEVARKTHAKFGIAASGIPVEDAMAATAEVHDRWVYRYVTPKLACETLGYATESDEQAVELFNQICPPAPEPLRVTALRGWSETTPLKLTVFDWLDIYPEVALRVLNWEQTEQ